MGLKAEHYILAGELVTEYVGEVIDEAEMNRRSDSVYIMELDDHVYIDARRKGNLSRFINHSCDPNCVAERW
jgi:SET domain-containing protein